MTNIVIDNVRVFSYGGDQDHSSGYGNQVYSLFNIGTYGADGGWPFCDKDVAFTDNTFTFENVKLSNWWVDTDPIRPSGVGEAFSPPGYGKFTTSGIVLEDVYVRPNFYSDPDFYYSPTFDIKNIVIKNDDGTALFDAEWFVGGGNVPV